MGKLPETKEAALFEKHNWENIIHSEEWVVFRKLLREHCEYLQKEGNGYLLDQKYTEAYGSLRAMKDAEKILTLVTIRISDINKQSDQGGR